MWSASDRRARFIGVDAYQAAGGHIVRDLFDAEHEGYFDNPELLNRLVAEKLEREADPVRAEGWKWVIVTPEFHYALASGMRRVYPETVPLSDEDQAKLDALESEHEALSVQYADENLSDEIAAEFERLEAEIEALRARTLPPRGYRDLRCVRVLEHERRTSRGARFLRPDDEPTRERDSETVTERARGAQSDDDGRTDEDDDEDSPAPLSDRLVAELTAHRTAALRDALAQNPDIALLALMHALAAQTFYASSDASCLTIEVKSPALVSHAPGIGDSPAIEAMPRSARRAWAKRLPRDVAHLVGLSRRA